MRATRVALLAAVLALGPAAAQAAPIGIGLDGSSTGILTLGTISAVGTSITIDGLTLATPSSVANLLVSGLELGPDYTVLLNIAFGGILNSLTAEVLDPADRVNDEADPSPQPGYVPPGFSTSTDYDGLSFAQRSGLERSLTSGAASIPAVANETTDAHDLLTFSGFTAEGTAAVRFGLREWNDEAFLLNLTTTGTQGVPAPEPATLLLIGTGLLGVSRVFRRRKTVS